MLLLAAAALTAAPQPGASRLTPSNCPRTTSYVAREGRYSGKPLQPQELTEVPPANLYVAVLRHDANGCEWPIVVNYDVNGR
jgi:hypothetical protein